MTDSANAFLLREILTDMRTQALQRLKDQRPGHYIPSPELYQQYQQLMALPRSNSDDVDDGIALIKSDARNWANNIMTSSQSSTTDATNSLIQTMDQAAFFAKMEQSRIQTLQDTTNAINSTYDKAEAEAGTSGTDGAAQILAASQLAESNLNIIAGQIYVFLQMPKKVSAEEWAKRGPTLSYYFYNELVPFIQVAFE